MSKFKRTIQIIKLWMLKKKANRLFRKTGLQQFIVKAGGKALIINKYAFKQARQKGLFPKNFTACELKQIALYHTKKR